MSLGVPLPNSWASLTAPPASHAGGQAADPELTSGPGVGKGQWPGTLFLRMALLHMIDSVAAEAMMANVTTHKSAQTRPDTNAVGSKKRTAFRVFMADDAEQ